MEPLSSHGVPPTPHRPAPKRAGVTGVLARLWPDVWTPSQEGFATHLRDALASNRARREVYAARSGGASRALSDHVIRLERLTLPFAALFDLRARRFNRQGIPIVSRDLVSMSGVRPADTPPEHRGVATRPQVRQLEGWLAAYRKDVSRSLGRRDFERIAELTHDLLGRIEGLEVEADAHFAMTKHVAESVGYAALHAVDYHAQSGGKTDDLAARFIRLQAFGLMGTVPIDQRAQALQQQGLGIIVNDLPAIPFEAEWRERRAA